ncbi:MAG: hypothetical protein ABI585_03145 [Betaproteobacteria bacterium]
MATPHHVKPPVKDLARSTAFLERLGFAFDPQYTDRNATCAPMPAPPQDA